jgi:hypothetical protein
MDGHLNHEQLRKVFMDLSHHYKEAARIGVSDTAVGETRALGVCVGGCVCVGGGGTRPEVLR